MRQTAGVLGKKSEKFVLICGEGFDAHKKSQVRSGESTKHLSLDRLAPSVKKIRPSFKCLAFCPAMRPCPSPDLRRRDHNSRSLQRRLWHPCRMVQHPKVLPRIAEASLPPARIFKSLPPPGQRSFASGSTNNRYSRQQLLLHRRISSLRPLAVFAHYPPKYVSPGPPVQPRQTPPDASPASHCTPTHAPGQR